MSVDFSRVHLLDVSAQARTQMFLEELKSSKSVFSGYFDVHLVHSLSQNQSKVKLYLSQSYWSRKIIVQRIKKTTGLFLECESTSINN